MDKDRIMDMCVHRAEIFCFGRQPMLTNILIATLSVGSALFAAGDTRLSEAAMQGNRDAVRSLMRQKVDVNAAQTDGATALHWAASRDDLEMVTMLLAAGANVKAATRD